jgi:hypothetical protein
VEVRNDYLSFDYENLDDAFTKDMRFVLDENQKSLPGSGVNSLQFKTEDAYLSFDVRDSYLQR